MPKTSQPVKKSVVLHNALLNDRLTAIIACPISIRSYTPQPSYNGEFATTINAITPQPLSSAPL